MKAALTDLRRSAGFRAASALFALGAVAAHDARAAETPAATAHLRHAASASSTACRKEPFETFLHKFESDPAFQRRHVADPFQDQHVDPLADPEPAVVTDKRPVHGLKFPADPAPSRSGAIG